MALSDFGKVCLFSSISGVITLDGKPVAGAHLVRTGNRAGDKTDETLTDAKGYFTFPAMFERTITKYLPQEFVASQKIVVLYQDKQYEMWTSIKRNPKENTESKGKPLIISCELNSEEKTIIVNRVIIHSLCGWDVEPDPEIIWDESNIFEPDSNAKNNNENHAK